MSLTFKGFYCDVCRRHMRLLVEESKTIVRCDKCKSDAKVAEKKPISNIPKPPRRQLRKNSKAKLPPPATDPKKPASSSKIAEVMRLTQNQVRFSQTSQNRPPLSRGGSKRTSVGVGQTRATPSASSSSVLQQQMNPMRSAGEAISQKSEPKDFKIRKNRFSTNQYGFNTNMNRVMNGGPLEEEKRAVSSESESDAFAAQYKNKKRGRQAVAGNPPVSDLADFQTRLNEREREKEVQDQVRKQLERREARREEEKKDRRERDFIIGRKKPPSRPSAQQDPIESRAERIARKKQVVEERRRKEEEEEKQRRDAIPRFDPSSVNRPSDQPQRPLHEIHREFVRLPREVQDEVNQRREQAETSLQQTNRDLESQINRMERLTEQVTGMASSSDQVANNLAQSLRDNIQRRRELLTQINQISELQEATQRARDDLVRNRERIQNQLESIRETEQALEEMKEDVRVSPSFNRPVPSNDEPRPTNLMLFENHRTHNPPGGNSTEERVLELGRNVERDARRLSEAAGGGARRAIGHYTDPLFDPGNGMRARAREVRARDGSTSRVISIGVPQDHPFADADSRIGDSDLYNMRIGPVRLPPAPTILIRMQGPNQARARARTIGPREEMPEHEPETSEFARAIRINPRNEGDEPSTQELEEVDNHVDRITEAINMMISRFQRLFSGFQLMRLQENFSGVSPNMFMSNFDQQFGPEQAIIAMVQRISEQEAEEKRKKNRASEDAIKKLPIIDIEEKHCKKKGFSLEEPTCTVCVEHIKKKTKGMFMPCGHIYHPSCLKPWLENHNSCPVCRYELPKQEE